MISCCPQQVGDFSLHHLTRECSIKPGWTLTVTDTLLIKSTRYLENQTHYFLFFFFSYFFPLQSMSSETPSQWQSPSHQCFSNSTRASSNLSLIQHATSPRPVLNLTLTPASQDSGVSRLVGASHSLKVNNVQ